MKAHALLHKYRVCEKVTPTYVNHIQSVHYVFSSANSINKLNHDYDLFTPGKQIMNSSHTAHRNNDNYFCH